MLERIDTAEYCCARRPETHHVRGHLRATRVDCVCDAADLRGSPRGLGRVRCLHVQLDDVGTLVELFQRGRDKLVRAFDPASGKQLWEFAARARVDSSPVIAGNRVYVGGNDGKLYVLDLQSGKSVFEFEAGGPLSASPAVASGRLVIGSQDGKLFCLG